VKRYVTSILALLLLGLSAAPACDNPRPVAPLNNGLAGCKEMRKLCAAPADAFGGVYAGCRETGVANVGSECLDVYDSCVEACREALMSLGGAGGAGGEGGTSSEAVAGEGGVRQ
jgi:hypothetical protein